jgi:hypothetical protein
MPMLDLFLNPPEWVETKVFLDRQLTPVSPTDWIDEYAR